MNIIPELQGSESQVEHEEDVEQHLDGVCHPRLVGGAAGPPHDEEGMQRHQLRQKDYPLGEVHDEIHRGLQITLLAWLHRGSSCLGAAPILLLLRLELPAVRAFGSVLRVPRVLCSRFHQEPDKKSHGHHLLATEAARGEGICEGFPIVHQAVPADQHNAEATHHQPSARGEKVHGRFSQPGKVETVPRIAVQRLRKAARRRRVRDSLHCSCGSRCQALVWCTRGRAKRRWHCEMPLAVLTLLSRWILLLPSHVVQS
mmetsp:Transcript_76419/g.183057  ORF Transcript_76419/g.183057 Transcript_76419/m.183057 type:complete len:257 (+) Transcript_76419:2018-2788(+)